MSWELTSTNTVDGRNPVPVDWLVYHYPIEYRGFYITGGDRRISEPSNLATFESMIFRISNGGTCFPGW